VEKQGETDQNSGKKKLLTLTAKSVKVQITWERNRHHDEVCCDKVCVFLPLLLLWQRNFGMLINGEQRLDETLNAAASPLWDAAAVFMKGSFNLWYSY